jgi:hypothetical protein
MIKEVLMSDFNHKANSNDSKINIKEALDLHFWCDELNLKADELKDIVKQVGPVAHDVRLHIAKKLLISWPVTY